MSRALAAKGAETRFIARQAGEASTADDVGRPLPARAGSRLLARRRWPSLIVFFTVETVGFRRLYVIFCIELGSRHVHIAGCTPHPTELWVTQQVRQVMWTLPDRAEPFRYLIRDRDQKFTKPFDEAFASETEARQLQSARGLPSQGDEGVAERKDLEDQCRPRTDG